MGNEVQEFQPLCLQSYVKLITNSRSLTKAVRSLARYNFMRDTSSSDIITCQDSIVELLRKDVSIEILPASHQFLNKIESTIRVFKSINRTISFGVPSEQPLITWAEISMMYSHITNILNSRPLAL